MSRSRTTVISAVLSLAAVANAIVTPNLPYGAVVDRTGSTCNIGWAVDTTGTWNSMDIELMTGDNLNFVHLAWVARGVDGTASPGAYSWTCPEVTINAPIYFYQFRQTGQENTYTTRFTIAAADGTTVAAPNAVQPNGQAIPWGTGAIVGGSDTAGSSSSSSTAAGGSSSSSGSSSSGSSSSPASSVVSSVASSDSSVAVVVPSASTDSTTSETEAQTTVITVQPSSSSTAIRRLSTSSDAASSTTGLGSAAANGRNTTTATGTAVPAGAATSYKENGKVAAVGMVLALAAGLLTFA